jgi:hypothetical protein
LKTPKTRIGDNTVSDLSAPASNTDLLAKFHVKSWANVSRAAILNNIAQPGCLTARVYWVLILHSWCGRHVTEACFQKDDIGFLVRDRKGNPVPLRSRDVLDVLKSTDRPSVSRAIKRLIKQKRLLVRDGLWYPVFDPSALADPPVSQNVVSTDNNLAYTFLGTTFDFSNLPSVVSTATLERLYRLREEFNTDLTALRHKYRDVAIQTYSEVSHLITEKIEEIEEIEHSDPLPATPAPAPQNTPEPFPSLSNLHERLNVAWTRYRDEYPLTVTDEDREFYNRCVCTDADVEFLFTNLEAWKLTQQFRDGKVYSVRSFFERGYWRTIPKEPEKKNSNSGGKLSWLKQQAQEG